MQGGRRLTQSPGSPQGFAHSGAAPLLFLLVAAAVVAAVGIGGGFDPGSQLLFAGLAGAALLAALATAADLAVALARRTPVALVAGLAVLAGVSALWTEGAPADAVRWALVVGGYGALAVAAGVLAAHVDRAPLAGGIAAVALLSAIGGLVAAAAHSEPLALRLDGSWRPAGPFEYPPALALVQVMALPALLWGAARGTAPVRLTAAFATAIALVAVVLSGSRLQLLFALALLGLAWLLVGCRRGAGLAVGVAIVALLGAAATFYPGQDNGTLGVDLGHGRERTWRAALEAGRERPLLGSGAETFEPVTASRQGMTAVRHAHNLPLEAWVELGAGGLALTLALYLAVLRAVWRIRVHPAAWLFGVGSVAFLAANLLDWSWHLAGAGALWAVCLGGTLAAGLEPRRGGNARPACPWPRRCDSGRGRPWEA